MDEGSFEITIADTSYEENMTDEESKIVVDDDWKSQVEKEKQQLEQDAEPTPGANDAMPEMPPASFSMLVTTLAMQAGVGLGQMPDPSTGQPQINKPVAKHFIDTLALLEEKTKGNLDKEETELLTSTVHQLRIAFITMPDSMPESTEDSGDEPQSSIELP